jgi:hypothetical protein
MNEIFKNYVRDVKENPVMHIVCAAVGLTIGHYLFKFLFV